MLGERPTEEHRHAATAAIDVSITMLGEFAIQIDNRRIGLEAFERRGAAELVQLLAMQPGRRLHRERVLDALWPGVPADRISNHLHKAASYARKALELSKAIVLRSEHVSLLPNHKVAVDVDVLLAVDHNDPASLTTARSVYRGDLLPHDPYTEWIAEARSDLRRRHLDVLRAVGDWAAIIEIDPTDEQAHIAQMQRAIERGYPGQALRQFAALEHALGPELGLRPGPEAELLKREAVRLAIERRTPRTDDTEKAALARPIDQPRRPDRPSGRPLVAPEGRTFGRSAERGQLAQALETSRLVTIVGAGGIGKTHLAQSLARDTVAPSTTAETGHLAAPASVAVAGFGAAWFCQLANVGDDAAAPQELLAAVGGHGMANVSLTESISRALDVDRSLLVIDSCEIHRESVRRLCRALLDRCPSLTILATSREPLRIRAERVLPLGPLDRAAAIGLFLDTAARHGAIVDSEDPALDRICRRLDDLPLAVQLAAGRAGGLPLTAIESLLDSRLDRFESADSTAPSRHRTLRSSISWSVDALDPVLRGVLADLTVLTGTFTLEAAVAVARRKAMLAVETVDAIGQLVDRSLLIGPHHGSGERYRMLESVHLYVAEQEVADPQAVERHLTYFADRATRSNEKLRDQAAAAIARFHDDWDEMRAAVTNAASISSATSLQAGHRIIEAVGLYSVLTQRAEVHEWYTMLGRDGAWAASLHDRLLESDGGLVERWLEDAGSLDGALMERALVAFLSVVTTEESGRSSTTADRVTELEALAANDDPVYRSLLEVARARHHQLNDPALAMASLEQAIELGDDSDLRLVSTTARVELVMLCARSTTVDRTAKAAAALRWFRDRGLWAAVLSVLPAVAELVADVGQPDVATTLLATRSTDNTASGAADRVADSLRAAHPDRFETWWRIGHALDPERAAGLAVRTLTALDADEEPV